MIRLLSLFTVLMTASALAQQAQQAQPTQQTQIPPPLTVNRGDANTSITASVKSADAQAQQPAQRTVPRGLTARERDAAAGEPDVLIDIPSVKVEEITLDVDALVIQTGIDARLGNLVSIAAGPETRIDRVKIELKGIEAETHIVVRLDNVREIMDHALTAIETHPELMEKLGPIQPRVGDPFRGASGTLLSSGQNQSGDTVQRVLDGDLIVLRTIDRNGIVIAEQKLARVTDLTPVKVTSVAPGRLVRQVRDESGAIIEFTLDAAGKVSGAKVVSLPVGPR